MEPSNLIVCLCSFFFTNFYFYFIGVSCPKEQRGRQRQSFCNESSEKGTCHGLEIQNTIYPVSYLPPSRCFFFPSSAMNIATHIGETDTAFSFWFFFVGGRDPVVLYDSSL